MFSKAAKTTPVSGDKTTGTIIGEGIIIEEGVIKGTGNVRIDGKFSGDIDLDGHMIVGPTGDVNGEIKARSGLFAGKFNGNMFIKETVHLAPDSSVTGQIEAGKMIMDEEAVFSGHLSVSTQAQNSNQISQVKNQEALISKNRKQEEPV